jgi:cytoskeleton-associated protein 5
MIYAFMDVNLKAPRSMASPEMKQRPIQTSSTLTASAQLSTMATTSQGMSTKSKLSAIFKKIGDKATTSAGLEELYDFTLDHPEEDLQPQLERTSDAFQMYIKRGLQKVEKSRSKRHEPDAEQPPSPAAAAKTSAAVYRERLARIQQNVGDVAPVSVDIATITNDASDLERIRARMNRITAQAAGSAPAPCE